MYEYLSEFERWKNFNKTYNEKFSKIKEYVDNCTKKVDRNDHVNINLCSKPIIDIEKYNFDIQKRITSEIYDLCCQKTSKIEEVQLHVKSMKSCVDTLYKENEMMVKREIINRMDDLIKFLSH